MKHDLRVYKNKKVLVTGHTGFKGSWLSIWLNELGARVIGFSLPKWGNEYLFNRTRLAERVIDERGDITNFKALQKVFLNRKPDIVFHLAAQPLVRLSYHEPVSTLNTNIMGTAHVLDCIRLSKSVKAGVMITTDKCYKNTGWLKHYKETDELGGHDPYSASKAAAELVIDSYKRSSLDAAGKLTASVRAGNVIGGGDFAKDRLIPDCVKSLKNNKPVVIRNPEAMRPWQHVLDPVYGYLLLGAKLLKGQKPFACPWNFGPEKGSVVPVSRLADLIIKNWGKGRWINAYKKGEPHEARFLSLDISKAKRILGWKPRWNIEKAVEMTIRWYRDAEETDTFEFCKRQIAEYTRSK